MAVLTIREINVLRIVGRKSRINNINRRCGGLETEYRLGVYIKS